MHTSEFRSEVTTKETLTEISTVMSPIILSAKDC